MLEIIVAMALTVIFVMVIAEFAQQITKSNKVMEVKTARDDLMTLLLQTASNPKAIRHSMMFRTGISSNERLGYCLGYQKAPVAGQEKSKVGCNDLYDPTYAASDAGDGKAGYAFTLYGPSLLDSLPTAGIDPATGLLQRYTRTGERCPAGTAAGSNDCPFEAEAYFEVSIDCRTSWP